MAFYCLYQHFLFSSRQDFFSHVFATVFRHPLFPPEYTHYFLWPLWLSCLSWYFVYYEYGFYFYPENTCNLVTEFIVLLETENLTLMELKSWTILVNLFCVFRQTVLFTDCTCMYFTLPGSASSSKPLETEATGTHLRVFIFMEISWLVTGKKKHYTLGKCICLS